MPMSLFAPQQPSVAAGPMFAQPSRSMVDQLAALLTPGPQSSGGGGGGSPFSLADMMALSKMMPQGGGQPTGLGSYSMPAGSFMAGGPNSMVGPGGTMGGGV